MCEVIKVIFLIALLGSPSLVRADQKDVAEAEKALTNALGKQVGNFLTVRTAETAVISFRALLANMKKIQDEAVLDGTGPKSLDRVKKMMVKANDLKVRFETGIGELMGDMISKDGQIDALAAGVLAKSSTSARKLLNLDKSAAKVKTLKNMLDKEVASTCDEYSSFLSDWSGKEVYKWIKSQVAKLDGLIKQGETEVETLAKAALDLEMEKFANEAKGKAAAKTLNWLEGHEKYKKDEDEFNKNMQFTKMVMDSAQGAMNIFAGPISILGMKSKSEPAPMPERPPADVLSADQIKNALGENTKAMHEAQASAQTFAKKVKDAEAKVQKSNTKLRKWEQERDQLQQQLGKRVKEQGAVNPDHARQMIDAVSQFFFQKKNLMQLAASIESYNTFIKGWHATWEQFDKMPHLKKSTYLTRMLNSPMRWGMIAAEIWSSVQVFPDLLDKLARDPFAVPESEDGKSKVGSWRETIDEMWKQREEMNEKQKPEL